MTDQKSTQIPDLTLLSPEAAPFIYFDGALTYGVIGGAIQVELIANVVCPTVDGLGTHTKVVQTAHLRCSPAAAASLREAIDKALEMLSTAAAAPLAPNPGGKLN